jgi:hypothetical protein
MTQPRKKELIVKQIPQDHQTMIANILMLMILEEEAEKYGKSTTKHLIYLTP